MTMKTIDILLGIIIVWVAAYIILNDAPTKQELYEIQMKMDYQ